jgi:hypothetical protein
MALLSSQYAKCPLRDLTGLQGVVVSQESCDSIMGKQAADKKKKKKAAVKGGKGHMQQPWTRSGNGLLWVHELIKRLPQGKLIHPSSEIDMT